MFEDEKMNGYILLEGGAEFGGQMAEPDLRAIQHAGGINAPIGIIPTAAAPDHNDHHAGRNALVWFTHLGARQVEVIPLLDRPSAELPATAEALRRCRLIYMLGGFPDYLSRTLSGSAAWGAAVDAYHAGSVLGGSSAGAMVLCQHYFDPAQGQVVAGLDLLHNACVIPHHNSFGREWAHRLAALIPDAVLIAIDERTGTINDASDGGWTVYGQGKVTLYQGGQNVGAYRGGETFSIPALAV
jgi:cyanophycinase